VQEYYYDDKLKFVCAVIIRLEPSNYFIVCPCVCFVCISHHVCICLCFHLGIWPSGF